MAADMQRKRSSERHDGTLAPDGHSGERADSPTPGLAQGMEPGTGRAQPEAGVSQPLAGCHSLKHLLRHSLGIGKCPSCREPAFLPTPGACLPCAIWLPEWALLLGPVLTGGLPGSFSLPQLSPHELGLLQMHLVQDNSYFIILFCSQDHERFEHRAVVPQCLVQS